VRCSARVSIVLDVRGFGKQPGADGRLRDVDGSVNVIPPLLRGEQQIKKPGCGFVNSMGCLTVFVGVVTIALVGDGALLGPS